MHYHIIGINGSSLSGIAQLLRAEGHAVTGTDAATTGHGPEKLPSLLDVVIYSEAITPGSAGWSELDAARSRGVQTFRRIEFIAQRMVGHTGIAVAGAHGKSTTTAQLGWIFAEAGFDPTVFIGADVPAFGGSARSGRGEVVISEACEWNRQFLELRPRVLVVTSMDREHLDTYPGGESEISAAFRQAVENVQPDGFVVANGDDELTRQTLTAVNRPVHWVGRSSAARYQIIRTELTPEGQLGVGLLVDGVSQYLVSPLVGEHQAGNLTAAVAVAFELGLDRQTVRRALTSFPGLKRRFERYRDDAILTIIDDYAHHPAEIMATLRAARGRYPGRRIVAAFQPHLSERTTDLFSRFTDALRLADQVLLIDTYEPAGRHVRPDAKQSHDLVAALVMAGGLATATGGIDQTAARLNTELRAGDILLTLGAGFAWQLAERFVNWSPGLVD